MQLRYDHIVNTMTFMGDVLGGFMYASMAKDNTLFSLFIPLWL